MHRAVVLFVLAACGPRASTPAQDFGPPAEPADPIACAAARLEQFAAVTETAVTISTEDVVDAGRIDKLPCKPDETDPQCIERARKRGVPLYYEVTGVTIGGDDTTVELTYELDGRRFTEQGESMKDMVARLKALQAAGHKVVVVAGGSAAEGGSRHAAIAYRGVGGQQRRIATLLWRPTRQDTDVAAARARAMENIQGLAGEQRIEVRNMEPTGEDKLVVTITCGAGG